MNNRFGVDVDYFRRELKALSDSLDDRPPDELHTYLRTLADIVIADRDITKIVKRLSPSAPPISNSVETD